MSLSLLAVGFLSFLVLGYFTYGRWIARQFGLSHTADTPAHLKRDGVDFEPTRPFYLFGQHFSAIAAAGPIAGPIVACLQFGWLPCLLWIGFGVVLIGAVHDFAALTASVRHDASSLAEIARQQISHPVGKAFMGFVWLALIYVIVAFSEITAGTFVHGMEEIEGTKVAFHPGGAVAAASIFYLGLSMVLGLVQRFLKPPMWLVTVLFVPLAFATTYLGTMASTWFLTDIRTWSTLIIAYCAVGSVLPVWFLLQPRGFLGGFILYFAIAVGLIGIFFGGYSIEQPAVKEVALFGVNGNSLFPFLFVTIACGACSGFHGLVCSGSTSKQIDREAHMHSVGYGAMLAEAFVAFIALAVVMIASPAQLQGLKPGTIYGNGIGEFLTLVIGRENLAVAVTFGAMAFSTFVFDTLDVATRLGRYLVQELLGIRGKVGATLGTLATVAPPICILWTAPEGSWARYWALFGASNQLLAGLTLLTITVWLFRAKKRYAFTLIPAVFVLMITLWSLTGLSWQGFEKSQGFDGSFWNGIAGVGLLLMAAVVISGAVRRLRGQKE